MKKLFQVFIPKETRTKVEEILYSGNLNSGVYVQEFENKIKKYLGIENFIAVNSYSSASTIVWDLIGIKSDDEVIASPMSCLASNQPLAMKKAKVKWCDIDPNIGSLDPDQVEKNITNNTKAILHYHWGGYPGYIDEVVQIGRKYGIPVVEDAIESFGSEYKGKKLGNTGADFTLFSFQPVRLPTTIDGGGIVIRNLKDYSKAKLIRDYGINRSNFRDELGEINPDSDISTPGISASLNELNAYIGSSAMNHIPELLAIQRKNAESNYNSLIGRKSFKPINTDHTLPNYWVYSFLTKSRDELLKEFRNKGIYASKVHIRNDNYSVFNAEKIPLKGVDEFNDSILSIPSGWWL